MGPRPFDRALLLRALAGLSLAIDLACLACDGCAMSTPADGAGTPCTRDGDCAGDLACLAGVCNAPDAGPADAEVHGDGGATDALPPD